MPVDVVVFLLQAVAPGSASGNAWGVVLSLIAAVTLLVLTLLTLTVGLQWVSVPSPSGLRPLEPEALHPDALDAVNALQDAGFVLCGQPVRDRWTLLEPAMVPLHDASLPAFAVVYQSAEDPVETWIELRTALADGGILVTANAPVWRGYPLCPDSFAQHLPGATATELRRQHRDALNYLAGWQRHADAAHEPDDFPDPLRREHERIRRSWRQQPLRLVVHCLSPRGPFAPPPHTPLSEQPAARKRLERDPAQLRAPAPLTSGSTRT